MQEPIQITYFKTPFGELILGSYKGVLCMCDWRYRKMRKQIDTRIQNYLKTSYCVNTTADFDTVKEQLTQYFSGERTSFSFDLLLVGTSFQKQVWQALIEIPYGTTQSYLDLSKKLNNPLAIRAVAAANGANAISIIVPCHRIIGSDGSLVGYAGGIETKKKLLRLEGSWDEKQLRLF